MNKATLKHLALIIITASATVSFRNIATASELNFVEENWKIYFESRKDSQELVPADVYTLSELNINSEKIMGPLSECARRQNNSPSKIYFTKINFCYV